MTAVSTFWCLASCNSVEYEIVFTFLCVKSEGMMKMPMTKMMAADRQDASTGVGRHGLVAARHVFLVARRFFRCDTHQTRLEVNYDSSYLHLWKTYAPD